MESDSFNTIIYGSRREIIFKRVLAALMMAFCIAWFTLMQIERLSWPDSNARGPNTDTVRFTFRSAPEYHSEMSLPKSVNAQPLPEPLTSLSKTIPRDFDADTYIRIGASEARIAELFALNVDKEARANTLDESERRNDTPSDSNNVIFDPRVRDHIQQAAQRRTRLSNKRREVIETYSDGMANEVIGVKGMCFKNDRALADVMGVDSMYFRRSCGTKKYKIKFDYDHADRYKQK